METQETQDALKALDARKGKQMKVFYPLVYAGNGLYSSYFGNFLSMVLTDVYVFPVVLAGILPICSSFIKWFYGPAFGAFIDGFTFKKGKFWPWIRIGIFSMAIAQVLIFAMPALGVDSTKIGVIILVFLIQLVISFSQPLYSTSINSVYPRITKDPTERNLMAVGQNVGREASKSIFGAILPAVILAMTGVFGDKNTYAILAVICIVITYLPHFLFSCALKDSYIERDALKEAEERKTKKEPVKVGKILEAVFTNRAVLAVTVAMIAYKAFTFMYSMSGIYVFRYYFGNFAAYGPYSTVFNLCCIGGVFVGVYWRKLWKDTKKAFVIAISLHLATILVICLTFSRLTPLTFTILIGVAQFFAGLYDAYFVPMFAAGADYGEYKTGKRADGLTMAIYTMGVTFGSTVNTAIRTAILSKTGYDAAAYKAGEAVSAAVKGGLANLMTWIPLCICAVCLLAILLFYPLSDKKHAEIIAENAKRREAEVG